MRKWRETKRVGERRGCALRVCLEWASQIMRFEHWNIEEMVTEQRIYSEGVVKDENDYSETGCQ